VKALLREIEFAAQVAELEQQASALAFLWVAWAIHAHRSEKTALELVANWNESHPQLPLVLWKIDLSDQTGAVWDAVDARLAPEESSTKDSLLYGESGGMVWVRSGQIVERVVSASAESAERLLEITEKIFDASQQHERPSVKQTRSTVTNSTSSPDAAPRLIGLRRR
jgi:hypothetical protein